MIEIDKSKLKDSLLNLKKEEVEEYPYDYIVIDIKKSEAFGGEFEYEHSYNKWGDEVDEWIVEIEDNDTEYIFDRRLIDYEDFEAFTSNIEKLIYYRSRANKAYENLLSYAHDIVEEYEYKHIHFAQIAWNIKDGKIYKRSFGNVYVYEEQKIDNEPSEGVFTLSVDEFIEEKCCIDSEGYEQLEGYYTNEKVIRSFVFGSLSSYYCYEDFGLYYPDEFLDSMFEFTPMQSSEKIEENINNDTETTVKVALMGIKCYVKQSLTSYYEGTDIPIVYLTLQEEYKGQDYLVMSKSVAQEYLSIGDDDGKKEFLLKCTVSYSKEADCYGITMPQTYVTIAEYQF